jgi:hypothetical protein
MPVKVSAHKEAGILELVVAVTVYSDLAALLPAEMTVPVLSG